MNKNRKKGFSLVELLIVVAILSALAAFLAPALLDSVVASREKVDKMEIVNLETTLKTAMQHNSIYKDAKQLADNTTDGTIVFIYAVGRDNVLYLESCEMTDKQSGFTTDKHATYRGADLAALKAKVNDFINGKIEPIEMTSKYYQTHKCKITVTFPDVEFKVNTSVEIE